MHHRNMALPRRDLWCELLAYGLLRTICSSSGLKGRIETDSGFNKHIWLHSPEPEHEHDQPGFGLAFGTDFGIGEKLCCLKCPAL